MVDRVLDRHRGWRGLLPGGPHVHGCLERADSTLAHGEWHAGEVEAMTGRRALTMVATGEVPGCSGTRRTTSSQRPSENTYDEVLAHGEPPLRHVPPPLRRVPLARHTMNHTFILCHRGGGGGDAGRNASPEEAVASGDDDTTAGRGRARWRFTEVDRPWQSETPGPG